MYIERYHTYIHEDDSNPHKAFLADMPSLPVKIMIAPKLEDNILWERNVKEKRHLRWM